MDKLSKQQALTDSLHSKGRRLTRQRQVIMAALQASRGHLDAEALHDRVKASDPRISLATVYRTLSAMRELGLVASHQLGEDHAHFEATRKGRHYHFACYQCGRVIEFTVDQVKPLLEALGEQAQLQITDVQLLLQGYCLKCQASKGVDHHGS